MLYTNFKKAQIFLILILVKNLPDTKKNPKKQKPTIQNQKKKPPWYIEVQISFLKIGQSLNIQATIQVFGELETTIFVLQNSTKPEIQP